MGLDDAVVLSQHRPTMWDQRQFGLRVKQARLERALSLDKVQQATGISAGELSRIERGLRHSVGIPQAVLLCEALGVRIEWLIFGRGVMEERPASSHVKVRVRNDPQEEKGTKR